MYLIDAKRWMCSNLLISMYPFISWVFIILSLLTTIAMPRPHTSTQKLQMHQFCLNTKPKADIEWIAAQSQAEADNNRHINYLLIDTARRSVRHLMNC